MRAIKIKNSSETVYPGKILCVGRNYAAHAREMGNKIPDHPIIFIKPPSNLLFNRETIVQPVYSQEMHHEIELVLLVGRTVKNASEDEAEKAIEGYAVGLDMTLRDIQQSCKVNGHPWTLAKCFDGSAVVSEFVLKRDYTLTMNERIFLKVNNHIRQDSFLNKMIFSPSSLVRFISTRMTLESGDLVFTGTPEGVGRVVNGDRIEACIQGIGELYTEIFQSQADL